MDNSDTIGPNQHTCSSHYHYPISALLQSNFEAIQLLRVVKGNEDNLWDPYGDSQGVSDSFHCHGVLGKVRVVLEFAFRSLAYRSETHL